MGKEVSNILDFDIKKMNTTSEEMLYLFETEEYKFHAQKTREMTIEEVTAPILNASTKTVANEVLTAFQKNSYDLSILPGKIGRKISIEGSIYEKKNPHTKNYHSINGKRLVTYQGGHTGNRTLDFIPILES